MTSVKKMKSEKKGPALRTRKPFELMASLSKKEIKEFGNYLASPFFIPNEKRRKIMQVFCDRAVKLKVWDKDVDKARFVKGTDLPSDANAFDKLVSAFYDRLINFISVHAFQQDVWKPHYSAVKFYRERGIGEGEWQKRIHLAEKHLSETDENGLHFRNRVDLELEKAEHRAHRSYKPSEGRVGALHQYLDNYFYIEKMRFLCATLNEQYIFPAVDTPPATAEALNWIENFPNPPLLGRLYHLAFQILNGEDQGSHFEKLTSLLENNAPSSYTEELGEIYGYLINYYIRRLNRGDYSCLVELDQLYFEVLKTPLLFVKGELSDASFKNIISIKARRGNFEDAREFMENYAPRLNPDFRQAALDYNHAVILFHEQKFAAAIELFETLAAESLEIKIDHFYGLDIRCFLLKSYYEEMQDADWKTWEMLDEKCHALVRSLQAYIDRRRISERRKGIFHEFLALFKALLKVQNEPMTKTEKQSAWTELKENVMAVEFLSDRDWFLEKISRGQDQPAP